MSDNPADAHAEHAFPCGENDRRQLRTIAPFRHEGQRERFEEDRRHEAEDRRRRTGKGNNAGHSSSIEKTRGRGRPQKRPRAREDPSS